MNLLRLIADAFRAEPDPPLALVEGRAYHFKRWPDDGERYDLHGDRLVNRTLPRQNGHNDLAVMPDGALHNHRGARCGHIRDLEPWPEGDSLHAIT